LNLLRNAGLKKLQAVLFPAAVPDHDIGDRSVYERFALPYVFTPRLSLLQALAATLGALLQIFLGSLLFAVWGAYTILVWPMFRSYFWRVAVLLPMLALFLLLLALVITGIAALVRMVSQRLP
jgi:hypothetical protein